ncbi:MAG: hypothetical protein ACFFD1_10415 [Candidatus Thorarchaeota archaeon]
MTDDPDSHFDNITECMICGDKIENKRLICSKPDCFKVFEENFIFLNPIVSLFADDNPDWSEFYKIFIELSSSQQMLVLVNLTLPQHVFWYSLQLLDPEILFLFTIKRSEFREKFITMLTPKIKEEIVKELNTWLNFDVNNSLLIQQYTKQLEAYIIMILEHLGYQETFNDADESSINSEFL